MFIDVKNNDNIKTKILKSNTIAGGGFAKRKKKIFADVDSVYVHEFNLFNIMFWHDVVMIIIH